RADLLSLAATVPALFAELRRHPSVVRAAGLVSGQTGRDAGTGPAAAHDVADPRRDSDPSRGRDGGGNGGPGFGTLRGGRGAPPAGLRAASGAQVRLRLPVREIRRTDHGFRLTAGPVPDPTYLDADAVVVAVPANKAAPMLRPVAPAAATDLAGIEYASM